MESITDKLESMEEIDSVEHHDPEECVISVEYEGKHEHTFSEEEITLIRDGKLTPLSGGATHTYYEYHMRLDEQKERKGGKFTFNA